MSFATLLVASTLLSTPPAPPDFIMGVQAWTFNRFTAFEAVEMTARAGSSFIELYPGQRLRVGSEATVGPEMGADLTQELQSHMASNGVRPVAFGVTSIPVELDKARLLFRWAKGLGIQVINTESTESLDTIEAMVREFDIKVGFHNHPKRPNDPAYRMWDPAYVLSLVAKRDRRVGACADTGHWVRSGVKPRDALRLLKGRIVSSHLKDLHEFAPSGHDVPYGTGVSDIAGILDEFRSQRFLGPASVEYEYNEDKSLPEVASCLGFVRGYLK